MIGVVTDESGRVAQWVAEQIGHVENFGPHLAVGVRDDSGPLAGVVYHSISDRDVQVSMASLSPRWARKEIIKYLFRVGFEHLGKSRMTAITPKRNKKARKLLQGLGFREEGCAEKFFDDSRNGDAMLYGMTKRNCKWIKTDG